MKKYKTEIITTLATLFCMLITGLCIASIKFAVIFAIIALITFLWITFYGIFKYIK